MTSPSLDLKLGQQLALTPQLRQALRLLQMSTLELRQITRDALENNVMLEADEDENQPPAPADEAAEANGEAPVDFNDETNVSVDLDWDGAATWDGGSAPPPLDVPEPAAPEGETLREHLLWQIELMRFSEIDAAIALALIDGIDECGYLREDLTQIAAALPAAAGIGRAEIEMVLHRIQTLDPIGVGARNVRECLAIQLRHLNPRTPARELALALVDEHLELLANRDFERLKDELKTGKDELNAAIALIHTLNPKPGALLAHSQADYVIPDVLVSRQDGRWIVELNPEVAPRLRVNALYAACLDRGRRSDSAHGLRRDLQEARWLIRSLKMRNHTLLRVAHALVEHQQAFLTRGEEAMRPLVMKDLAERLDMHESTISRVTAGKYMYTPRGIFEFKYFFSTQVGEHGNEEHSATAIRAVIRKLIAAENPRRPLSDGQITTALGEQGIKLARRTTAKYRESMSIPASHERKQLGT